MKLLSLIKAAFSQDMSLFSYNAGKNASKKNKVLMPILLFLIICLSFTSLAYRIGEMLKPMNLVPAMLAIFLMGCVFIAFSEGIYKSQGILFEAKDNDLLFSLPIKKSDILALRIIKILVFEYLFNLMFILPAFIAYIILMHPGVNFYIISIISTVLLPLLPTVLSCVIGYIIKLISSKFKRHKLIETIFTTLFFALLFILSMNTNGIDKMIQDNALTIQKVISRVYYPISLYLDLIQRFDILKFLLFIIINIIPVVVFIMIGQKYYFNIISKSKGNSTGNKKKGKIVVKKPLLSLAKKELKRYFSSPVYIFNTSFGLGLLILLTLILSIKGKAFLLNILSDTGISNTVPIDILFYGIVIFTIYMTSITSSSISLEGKTINMTKSLPVSTETIFKSKILYCFYIELPIVILAIIIYGISFKPNIIYILELSIISIISIFIMAVIGLIVNLKYPKLNASNDTEVVKQSMSTMMSVLSGIGIIAFNVIELIALLEFLSIRYIMLINIVIFLILSVILYHSLITKGPKEYLDLNV